MESDVDSFIVSGSEVEMEEGEEEEEELERNKKRKKKKKACLVSGQTLKVFDTCTLTVCDDGECDKPTPLTVSICVCGPVGNVLSLCLTSTCVSVVTQCVCVLALHCSE